MTKLMTQAPKGSQLPGVISLSDSEKKVYLEGRSCQLTAQEYRLLQTLAQAKGQTLSRDDLLCKAWGYLSPGKSRTVDVHVQRLRRKLGCWLLETVHGYGYRLCAVPVPA